MSRAAGLRRGVVLGACALTTVCLAACSLLISTGGLHEDGIASEGGTVSDATADAADASSFSEGGADAGRDASNGCKGTAGAAMVRVTPSACIDATEATCAEYTEFLAAMNGGRSSDLPGSCNFKTSHVPAGAWPPSPAQGTSPVRFVDWCDAWAYCRWAGKQLCGSLTGESVPANNADNPDVDLWYRACSSGGATIYPWGDTFDGTKCNGPSAGKGDVVAVSSMPSCVGGLPGLFDMAGNVQEWVNSCSGTGASAGCADRGAAFIIHDTSQPESERLKCAFRDTTARNIQADNNGIRCCSY